VSRPPKKLLTFPEQCAAQLKGTDDILDRLYQSLTARFRQMGFALMPKWQQHELLREEGATRYITRDIADKHGHFAERATLWVDFTVMQGDEPGVAVCSVCFQFERFAPGDDPGLSSLPRIRLQRKKDIVWPDQGSAVWLFTAGISAKADALVDEFCNDVLADIAP
jgi:hypothetical protein